MERLKNKVALITGAAQGIGAEIAKLFVSEGAYVYVTDIQDKKGESFAKSLGENAMYLHLDVREEKEWESILANIQELNILVNNAGVMGIGDDWGNPTPEDIDIEKWRSLFQVNVDGAVLGCKHFIKNYSDVSGSIINMSSRSGMVGMPFATSYAASKAAISSLSKSVALYCANCKYPIRCNSLQPANILTDMWEPLLGDNATRNIKLRKFATAIPLQRFGTPLEVAYAAVYLASEEATYITGSDLAVDGGIMAGKATPKAFTKNKLTNATVVEGEN